MVYKSQEIDVAVDREGTDFRRTGWIWNKKGELKRMTPSSERRYLQLQDRITTATLLKCGLASAAAICGHASYLLTR